MRKLRNCEKPEC